MKQMASERKPYYAKMGAEVVGCSSVDEVIAKAGLDWTVEKRPIFLAGEKKITNKFATVRTDTEQVLGIVKGGYEVVQNRDGFDFIDDCLGEGITFTKAGTYNKGERVFMVGEAPSVDICGDEVYPTILFTNSHDGGGSINAMFTPMRLVCENGLMIPIPGHENGIVKLRISHTKHVKDRLDIAKQLIMQNNQYIEALRARAELLAKQPFSDEQFKALTKELAGIEVPNEGEEEKITRGQQSIITDLTAAYEEEDIARFRGTAYGAILAASDYDTHKESSRNTGNEEYQFERVAYGMTILVAAYQIVARMTGMGLRR